MFYFALGWIETGIPIFTTKKSSQKFNFFYHFKNILSAIDMLCLPKKIYRQGQKLKYNKV